MKFVQISATAWGTSAKETIQKNLTGDRTSSDYVSLDVHFTEDHPKPDIAGITHLTVRATPMNNGEITDADLGEMIRLILTGCNPFVTILNVQIE